MEQPFEVHVVEARWRERWRQEGTGLVDLDAADADAGFFNLVEFPYPSAEGLHVGHVFRYSGVVPCIEVAQLLLPNITCAAPRTVGATSATAGHSAIIALPSSSVSVTPAPLPSRYR